MSLYVDKSVEIEKLDNGWILTWRDETHEINRNDYWTSSPALKPKTRGREIFTSEAKLMKRIKELL